MIAGTKVDSGSCSDDAIAAAQAPLWLEVYTV